jgi:curved DNA-binding protein
MIYVDYYKILGIEKTATAADIKVAYRKMARKFHPDLNPNDKDAHKNFQQINEANEVLSDVEKRKKYDQYGSDWKHSEEFEKAKQQQQNSQSRQSRNFGGQSGSDFSDFFESMFGGAGAGGGRSRQAKYRGEDFNAELHLEFIDAYTTHKQTITVNDKKIRITIPAGIENGQTIKIVGHGGLGTNGGPNGDLIITFVVANHEKFKRHENNLYVTIEIDLYTAILGGDITIDTLSGKVKLKVKAGTQNGTKIKLSGKGFPIYKNEGSFGDLVVTFAVIIPKDLNEKQNALFTELSKM